MGDYKHIRDYIVILRKKFGLSVSLHRPKYDDIINSTELMPFNIHDNSYCTLIKTKSLAFFHCKDCQKRTLEKCKNGSFEGICYAGVKEFVYPINSKGKTIGFISVSGYKAANAESYINRTAQKYSFDIEHLNTAYNNLKQINISKRTLNGLIYPLCDMLELAYSKLHTVINIEETLPEKVGKYLKQHRNQNITSKDICEHFNCNRSYMSTTFNKHFGKSIREYLTELRLSDAKSLLKYSDLSVTEIAFSIGYTDANYFSNLFKKTFDISPIEYRKSMKQHSQKQQQEVISFPHNIN